MDFSPFVKFSDTFIETGTCVGDGIASALKAGFTCIKSVEASRPHYIHSNNRFKNNPKVTIYMGKSYERLPEMIRGIPCPSVFWLDAHPAGPGTAGHEDWVEGLDSATMHYIVKKELEIILKDGAHVILIDDINGDEDYYTDIIEAIEPERYLYKLVDEVRGTAVFKNKVLVCQPV